MSEDQDLLTVLMGALPGMSKSEAKVARVVLDAPEEVTGLSIAALAQRAEVSEPTVNRFSKKFGATGFPDFKLRLARAVVPGVRYISQAVGSDDSVDIVARKLLDNTIRELMATRDNLPGSALEQAAIQLAAARSIAFFGMGTSAAVARDAEHKFLRFGMPVTAHTDPMSQRMLAAGAAEGDVFFLISHTGRTRTLLEIADLVSESNGTLISLTAPGSPLVEKSDCAIEIRVDEDTDEYLPMTSRIVHLVLLDTLVTAVSLQRGPEFSEHLAKLKSTLRDTRVPAKRNKRH
jgi:RpiR family carbohydrate utilization transcriptional regulator